MITATIEGLLLQGCSFDNSKITEAHASAAEVLSAGPCTLAWIPADATSPFYEPNTATVDVPVYQNLLREKLITVLSMPCTGTKDKWLLAGIALFLSEE